MENNVNRNWRKASYSGNGGGNCVEVAGGTSVIMVRDTEDRAGSTLAFTGGVWSAFTSSLKEL